MINTKRMKVVNLFLLLFLFVSCDNPMITKYRFEKQTITRVDYYRKTLIFNGDCDLKNELCDTSKALKLTYNFRGGIDIYLIFKRGDSRIGVINQGDAILTINDTSLFYNYPDIPNPYYRDELKKMFDDKSLGIIRLSNSDSLQTLWNSDYNGRVIITKE